MFKRFLLFMSACSLLSHVKAEVTAIRNSPNVERNDVVISTTIRSIDFSTSFTVSDSPARESNVGVNFSSITAKGNSFNSASQLLLLDSSADVPDANLSSNVSLLGSQIDISGETNATASNGVVLVDDNFETNWSSAISRSDVAAAYQPLDATLTDLASAPLGEDNSISVGAIAAGSLPTDVIASSASATMLVSSFPAVGVTAGSYTNTNLTVDAYGRVTAAANGSAGGGGGTTIWAQYNEAVVSNSVSTITANGVIKSTLTASSKMALFLNYDTNQFSDVASTFTANSATFTMLGPSIDLSGAEATGTLAAGRFPALTGDVTNSAGSLATTIAADSVALGTDSTGIYVASLTVTSPITLSGTNNAESAAPILALTQNAGTDITADLEEEGVTCSNCVDISAETNATASNGVALTNDAFSIDWSSAISRTDVAASYQPLDATLTDLAAAPLSEDNSIAVGAIAAGSLPTDVIPSSFPATGVIAGTYGSQTQVGTFTVNAQGQITGATNMGIFITTTGINASGTASGTTFLRGDNSWASPAGSGDAILAATQTFSGQNTFTNAVRISTTIIGLQRIQWADGTVQVSSPPAGGGGGTTSFTYTWNAYEANLPGSGSPYISNSTNAASAGVFFDETSTQTVTYSSVLRNYQGGTLSADIVFTSSATSGTVNWGVYVECKTPSEDALDYDTDSFGTVNSTSVVLGSTANMLMKATATLSNGDSCANGDSIRVKLERRAQESDTAAAFGRQRFLVLRE